MGEGVDSPLVSIVCNTYNHVDYIRQCLDGFLMQKTTFSVEILVHDDASIDGTADIVREYEALYPDLIKPIYQNVNQYSKGVKVTLEYQYSRAKGKYIALCEGDDYWTDPLKLQKQVDFLESNPEFVMCSHAYMELYENKQIEHLCKLKDLEGSDGKDYSLETLISGEWYYQPLTVVFRRNKLDFSSLNRYNSLIDVILFYHLLKNGKGYCFNEAMATYRIHNTGVWSGSSMSQKRIQEYKSRLSIYNVEKSLAAALFLRSEFQRPISRICVIKHIKLFINCLFVIYINFGTRELFAIIFYKFILGKELTF